MESKLTIRDILGSLPVHWKTNLNFCIPAHFRAKKKPVDEIRHGDQVDTLDRLE